MFYRGFTVHNYNDDPQYSGRKQNLSVYNAILKKTIRECKIKYYHAMFNKYKYDIKNTWK